jgi:hypothetical protein
MDDIYINDKMIFRRAGRQYFSLDAAAHLFI